MKGNKRGGGGEPKEKERKIMSWKGKQGRLPNMDRQLEAENRQPNYDEQK